MHDDSIASPVAKLYANHHGWLRSWLHRRLGHSADAEDLAHDTFIRVLRSKEDVRELRQPMAFLATIANGLLIIAGVAKRSSGRTWKHWRRGRWLRSLRRRSAT